MKEGGVGRFLKLWGLVLALVLVAYVFRDILVPFVLAILLVYLLAPAVRWLAGLRVGGMQMPRGAAVLVCYVVLLSSMAVFFAAFLPRLAEDLGRLGAEAPKLWSKLHDEWTPMAADWIEENFDTEETLEELGPVVDMEPLGDLPVPPGTVATLTPLASGDFAVAVPADGVVLVPLDGGGMVLRPGKAVEPTSMTEELRGKLMDFVTGLEDEVTAVAAAGQAFLGTLLAAVLQLFLVLMIAGFMLVDLGKVHAFVRSVVPERYRPDYDSIAAGIDRGLGGVIRGQLLVCLINGVFIWVGLVIFDVKYSLLLAVLAAVLTVIPIFGSIMSAIPTVLVALVSDGFDLTKGVMVLGWILLVNFVEGNILGPRVMGSAARMHPVLVIFALLAGQQTAGLVGAVLAVPVASVAQTIFLYFRDHVRGGQPMAEAPAAVPPRGLPPQ